MAGPPIKFRCYQCNQLMGVSRSKAGRAVSCPRCAASLIVPEPDDTPAPAGQPVSSESTPAFLAALDAGLPIEIADIRPEDIRVARDDDGKPSYSHPDAPRPTQTSASEAFPFLAGVGPAAAGGRGTPSDFAGAVTPLSVPISSPEPAGTSVATPVPASGAGSGPAPAAAGVETLVPPIKFDAPSLVPERSQTVRARDIILPRSVVASWSLLVLLAQALAFVAGLLAGHYVWRVH